MQTKQNKSQMSRNPRKVYYQIQWRHEQDAVDWIHLSTAQDAGREFWQTGSNAIITCQSVPKESVVKVVSESGKRELFVRQLILRKGPKVTLSIIGSCEIQRFARASGNREQVADVELQPNFIRESQLAERGIRTICWFQSRRHPQRRHLQGRAEHANNCRISSKNCKIRRDFLDSPKERAAKKIHAAGNCELYEVQQRTAKVQRQRCYSYIEAGFQVCPCGGKLKMSEEMLSSIKQKLKQTHRKRLHDVPKYARSQAWCSAISIISAKQFMRKINKKKIYTSILDRFQNDEVFHASQLQHNWTKEWWEYLDYIETIDITHNDSPEQLERSAALYHFRYHPKYMEKGLVKSRPDNHETTRTIVSMNKEAGQNPQIFSRRNKMSRWSGLREVRMANMLLTQFDKVLRSEPTLRFKFHTAASSRSRNRASLGKPRSIDSNIW